MKERLDFKKASPDAYKAMAAVESHVRQSGLERALLELVKTRVSQINGCAYCLDMHTKDARANGESEQRLFQNGALGCQLTLVASLLVVAAPAVGEVLAGGRDAVWGRFVDTEKRSPQHALLLRADIGLHGLAAQCKRH